MHTHFEVIKQKICMKSKVTTIILGYETSTKSNIKGGNILPTGETLTGRGEYHYDGKVSGDQASFNNTVIIYYPNGYCYAEVIK